MRSPPSVTAPSTRPGIPPGTARTILVLLTVLNFLNYVDRYVLAAVLEKIKLDPAFAGVSDARLGLLQTAFLVVYMLASPASGALGHRVPRKYLVAAGVGLWSLATAASGLARDYRELFIARALIGFGEAGYATVAPAMLSDLFSRDRRARVLSIFYIATPVGSSLGFILGGAVAEAWSWRHAFFVAGGPGILLALLALAIPEPTRGAQDGEGEDGRRGGAGAARSWGAEVMALARNRDFLRISAATTLMTFSVGGLAFWMPTYFQEVRHLGAARANLYFGGIAVVAGIVGTFAGGFLGDAWTRRNPRGLLLLSGIGLLAATPFAAASPFAPALSLCLGLGFVAELFVFLNTGPLNTALINAVPPGVREVAVGINVLVIHLLGDAISPPLLGRLAEVLGGAGWSRGNALGGAVAATSLPLLLSGLVLLVAPRRRRPAQPA